jgi:dipeptidyl aminopeptidase/acylaminoacyl peptidase
MVWKPDSKTIFFTAANEIYTSIYKINIESPSVVIVVEKRINGKLKIKGNKLYFLQERSNLPHELFVSDLDGMNIKQLTFLNKELLRQLGMNEVQTFWSEGAEGEKVQSILLTPPGFDETKKYPMIFLVHGGPQGHWEDDFHYRWNLQMFAAKGYVVVAPNPRGSTGYGQKFTDGITKDWGGKVYTDLMNAYDYAIENYKYIDANNTFAAGASYGGYMISWIAGHTDRFNALVNHDGVYNPESMFGATEELWFPSWEFGRPWEDLTYYEKWAPKRYVKNFKTPMLVVHGGKDYRVPETQAFELFTALQSMNVESKFLYFPNENHFVLKPQNARLWWNTIYDWFEKYKR